MSDYGKFRSTFLTSAARLELVMSEQSERNRRSKTADEQDWRVRKLADEWHESGRMRVAIGSQLPWAVDEQGLRRTVSHCEQSAPHGQPQVISNELHHCLGCCCDCLAVYGRGHGEAAVAH